jgi:hypothetical protein
VGQYANAQTADTTQVPLVDAFDVIGKVLKRKHEDTLVEFQEKRVFISAIPGFGYSQLKGLALVLESNISFKTNKNANMSVIEFVPEFTFRKYIIPRLTASIWFKDNKFNLRTDWRAYKYVLNDYGVGGSTSIKNVNQYQCNYFKVHQVLSRTIKPDLLLGLGYYFDYHGNFKLLNEYQELNSNKQEFTKPMVSSGILVNLLFDNRRNENFPVMGETFFNINFIQNLKFLNSTSNYKTLTTDIRKYYSFSPIKSNVLALRSFNWLNFDGIAPLFDMAASQLDYTGSSSRPLIEGRYRGQNMLYFESEYRFRLTKNELFGAAIFTNLSSFSEPTSLAFKKIIYGAGGSFRIKVNKKSNVYFVASYGIGTDKAKGIFFSLGDIF